MVACYFDVAPACIFANKRGGIKAVITTAIIGGFILTVLCAISIPMVSSTVGTFLQVYGGNEYSVWVIIADALLHGFSHWSLHPLKFSFEDIITYF